MPYSEEKTAEKPETDEYQSFFKSCLVLGDNEAFSGFYVRGYMQGDCYKSGGMSRKVRKLFWQLGVDEEKRGAYPLICDKSGPVLLPGYYPRDDYRSKSGVKYIVNIYLYKNKKKGNP